MLSVNKVFDTKHKEEKIKTFQTGTTARSARDAMKAGVNPVIVIQPATGRNEAKVNGQKPPVRLDNQISGHAVNSRVNNQAQVMRDVIISGIQVQPAPCKDKEAVKESPLKFCRLTEFIGLLRRHYSMGTVDGVMKDDNGNPIKAWFTIKEVCELARDKGFDLTQAQAESYLNLLVRKGYAEARENFHSIEYRRRTCYFDDLVA